MRYAGADTQVVHSVVANRLVGDKKGCAHEKMEFRIVVPDYPDDNKLCYVTTGVG